LLSRARKNYIAAVHLIVMPACSLCRVEATPEHLACDWHVYNVKVTTTEGKTPMSRDLYDNFHLAEKKLASVAVSSSSSASSSAPASAPDLIQKLSSKNPSDWHWLEKKVNVLAHARFTELVLATDLAVDSGSMKVTEVKNLEGDCYLNNRKGRKTISFEMTADLVWSGKILDADGNEVVSATGKAHMPDITAEEDPEEFEIVNITCDGSTNGHTALKSVFKSKALTAIRAQCRVFFDEMLAKAHSDI
jgi:activator of HSP90 ATPase